MRTILRLTPKRAPFWRGGIHFKTLAAIEVAADTIGGVELEQLLTDPYVDVDGSADGILWSRFSLDADVPQPIFEVPIDPIAPVAAVAQQATPEPEVVHERPMGIEPAPAVVETAVPKPKRATA